MKLGRPRVGAAVIVFTMLVATLHAQQKRTLQPEDLVGIQSASDVQISPDARRIAFVLGQRRELFYHRDIWLVNADGTVPAHPFVMSEKSNVMPRWSPDGRYLAFLSGRSLVSYEKTNNLHVLNRRKILDEHNPANKDDSEGIDLDRNEPGMQIWLLPTGGGEAFPITGSAGEVEAFKWSPDSKMIAFAINDPLSEEEEKKQKRKDDAIHVDHDYKFTSVWILNLDDGGTVRISNKDVSVSDFAWSPDGSELAIRIAQTPNLDDLYWHSRLVVVSRKTGKAIRTIAENVGPMGLKWSPDGHTIAFGKMTPAEIWVYLVLASVAGGSPQIIDDDYKGTIWQMEWIPNSNRLLAESIEGTRAQFEIFDAGTRKFSHLAEIFSRGPDFSISADGGTIAFTAEMSNSPAEVWVMKLGETPRQLTHLNAEIESRNLGELREISWKNKKDGKNIYGVLITPSGYKSGQMYPTVVEVHGGPQDAWWSGWNGSWSEWGQLLASHGYAVLLPNQRGSFGQGWRFTEAISGEYGGLDFEDIMSGVDYLVEQKIADPERLGIGGWSYGGFLSAWAIGHTNRFRAAIVGAGPVDNFSQTASSDLGPTFLKSLLHDLPLSGRSAYEAHSPIAWLQNCKTPTLVLHGEKDTRVPVTQAWELYSNLKWLGVPVDMVIYPRERHNFQEQQHEVDLQQRVLSWYDTYLKK